MMSDAGILVSRNATGDQELGEGCRIMRRIMEDQKQWKNTLANKVDEEGDEYTPSQMEVGKSTQHKTTLVASVGKMVDILQLQMVWLYMEGPLGWQVPNTVIQEDEKQVGVKKARIPRNLEAGG